VVAAANAAPKVNSGKWEHQRDECVEAQGFDELPMENSGKGAGCSAAWALNVKPRIDRALRVEVEACWREQQKNGPRQGD
jgi:hypothetical protein